MIRRILGALALPLVVSYGDVLSTVYAAPAAVAAAAYALAPVPSQSRPVPPERVTLTGVSCDETFLRSRGPGEPYRLWVVDGQHLRQRGAYSYQVRAPGRVHL